MDVKWGAWSSVLLRPKGDMVELIAYDKDAPAAVLIGRQAVVSVLTPAKARQLGAALIRVANSV